MNQSVSIFNSTWNLEYLPLNMHLQNLNRWYKTMLGYLDKTSSNITNQKCYITKVFILELTEDLCVVMQSMNAMGDAEEFQNNNNIANRIKKIIRASCGNISCNDFVYETHHQGYI